MTTTLSSKGQIVLNASIRRSMRLTPGTIFSVSKENQTIVLRPIRSSRPKAKISVDALTGFSVLDVCKHLPPLTTERVRQMLDDFP